MLRHKNFYLGIPLIGYEYIKISIDILPEEIIMEHKLMNLAQNGYIYIYYKFVRECTASPRRKSLKINNQYKDWKPKSNHHAN